jgi:hypothetical protein
METDEDVKGIKKQKRRKLRKRKDEREGELGRGREKRNYQENKRERKIKSTVTE